MKRKKILLISLGRKGDTSYKVFSSLDDFLSERCERRRILLGSLSGSTAYKLWMLFWNNVRCLKDVIWADTVMLHAAAAPSIVLVLAARMMLKKVVIFQWDVYPTTIAGVRYKDGLVLRVLYRLERTCLALATLNVVPSDDFLGYVQGRKTVVLPLWPPRDLVLDPVDLGPIEGDAVHIAFAGQVNAMRGLAECVAHLAATNPGAIVLHVFSADRLPPDFGGVNPSMRVEQHGILPQEELRLRLNEMHFGLVSLNPLMDQPGFPSKTFDYIASGLPILYFGRPLPAYTSVIEDYGIGVDITNKTSIDLKDIHRRLSTLFEAGRVRYLQYTHLTWSKLANIC